MGTNGVWPFRLGTDSLGVSKRGMFHTRLITGSPVLMKMHAS